MSPQLACAALTVLIVCSTARAQPAAWEQALDTGDFLSAERELTAELERQPADPELQYQLARVLGMRGQTEDALVLYRTLLDAHPSNADYLLGEAQMLGRLNRTGEALRSIETAIELAPDYEDLWQLRFSLIRRAGDDEATSSARLHAAERFPASGWWSIPPPPPRYDHRVSAGLSADSLSNGAPGWTRQFVRLDWQATASTGVFIQTSNASRFDRRDGSVSIGGRWQPGGPWHLQAGIGRTSSADFAAARSTDIGAGRPWANGWGTEFRLASRDYATAGVRAFSFVGEKYFGNYRAALTLVRSTLDIGDSALSQGVSLSWYSEQGRTLTVNLGAGREIEAIGVATVLETPVRSITFSGREPLSEQLRLGWHIGTHRQGTYYRRRYAGLDLQFAF